MEAGVVRRFVLYCWLAGLIACALIYVIEAFDFQYRINRQPLFNSALVVFGFITPQFATMMTYLCKGSRRKQDKKRMARRHALMICGASALYQVLLVGLVVYAVMFYGFDSIPDGQMLARNTTTALALGGILSVFGVVPLSIAFKD
jgi:hypothetical protein